MANIHLFSTPLISHNGVKFGDAWPRGRKNDAVQAITHRRVDWTYKYNAHFAFASLQEIRSNKDQHNLATGGIAANWGFHPQISPFREGARPLSNNTMSPGTTRMTLPNGISFRPTALAGCSSMADGQTDKPRYGNICRNRRSFFQRCGRLSRIINPLFRCVNAPCINLITCSLLCYCTVNSWKFSF